MTCEHQFIRTETDKDFTDTCSKCGEVAIMEKNPTPESDRYGAPAAATVITSTGADTAPIAAAPAKGQIVVRAGGKIEGLVPTTIQEAWLFCSKMAQSFNLPESFYKMPKNIPEGMIAAQLPNIMDIATGRAMQAMQLGMEVGLPPAQAIQSVLVMNGIGTIWGDAQLGLVLGSGKADYVKEYTENGPMLKEGKPNPDYTWVCETKRKGITEPYFGRFTIADALKANLWGKTSSGGRASTWVTHPDRMGKYKARAFCLRDVYADVLKGLAHSREEFEGETIQGAIDITPSNSAAQLNDILEKKVNKP